MNFYIQWTWIFLLADPLFKKMSWATIWEHHVYCMQVSVVSTRTGHRSSARSHLRMPQASNRHVHLLLLTAEEMYMNILTLFRMPVFPYCQGVHHNRSNTCCSYGESRCDVLDVYWASANCHSQCSVSARTVLDLNFSPKSKAYLMVCC